MLHCVCVRGILGGARGRGWGCGCGRMRGGFFKQARLFPAYKLHYYWLPSNNVVLLSVLCHIALHCIRLCRLNVYFSFFGWVLQEFLVQSNVGIPNKGVRTNEHHDGPEWPHMSISSETLLGHARQHPYGPVWTFGQVQSSKIVGDKGVVSQFHTSTGSVISLFFWSMLFVPVQQIPG